MVASLSDEIRMDTVLFDDHANGAEWACHCVESGDDVGRVSRVVSEDRRKQHFSKASDTTKTIAGRPTCC